jgi:hypothetical protein
MSEIVMVLVGVVWGLGKGFAIVSGFANLAEEYSPLLTRIKVAVGTILGEVANYL